MSAGVRSIVDDTRQLVYLIKQRPAFLGSDRHFPATAEMTAGGVKVYFSSFLFSSSFACI